MGNKKKNKRAISEIVSYVLLIVIALSLASGVYVWLKTYVPPEKEREKCPEDVALSVNDYRCSGETITLIIENKGLFNVNGFFIRASNDSSKLPTIMLNSTDIALISAGRYDFENEGLKPNEIKEIKFSYSGLNKIARIQIQPFVSGKRNFLLCSNVADLSINDC